MNANLPVLTEWMRTYDAGFRLVPPRAGAMAYLRYSWPINSTRLIERLRDEQSLLVVPGDQFGMDGFLRIGLGNEPHDLKAGLSRMDGVLASLTRPALVSARRSNDDAHLCWFCCSWGSGSCQRCTPAASQAPSAVGARIRPAPAAR